MENPKPILVVKLPSNTSMMQHENARKSISGGGIEDEYHILVIMNGSPDKLDVEVEVLNSKDAKEADIEELKQLIIKTTYEK